MYRLTLQLVAVISCAITQEVRENEKHNHLQVEASALISAHSRSLTNYYSKQLSEQHSMK